MTSMDRKLLLVTAAIIVSFLLGAVFMAEVQQQFIGRICSFHADIQGPVCISNVSQEQFDSVMNP